MGWERGGRGQTLGGVHNYEQMEEGESGDMERNVLKDEEKSEDLPFEKLKESREFQGVGSQVC
jgi:hypothetical protein